MTPSKQKIRADHRAKRNALPRHAVVEMSQSIAARLLASDAVRGAKNWFIYVSCAGEVDTRETIRTLLERHHTVAVPLVVGEQIIPRPIRSLDELHLGTFGILEPPHGEPFSGPFDVCVCPGVAFDERGDRLGTGRGYYDRYLAAHRAPLVVGLAFDWQIVPQLPAEAYDQKMDLIITERRTISIRPALP